MPYATWPDPVDARSSTSTIHLPMRSQANCQWQAVAWDRTADLPNLFVPTISRCSLRYDGPRTMEWMAGQVQRGRYSTAQGEPPDALRRPGTLFPEGIITSSTTSTLPDSDRRF